MSKAETLDRFRQDRERWKTLLNDVDQSRMEVPGVMGEWTLKDLIAHLTGWRRRTVARLRAGSGALHPADLPWPADVAGTGDSDAEADSINQYFYRVNQHRPLQAVLEESDAVLDELDQALMSLPEAAFDDPACFPWLEGRSLSESDLWGHLHEEHEADIQRWLGQQRRA